MDTMKLNELKLKGWICKQCGCEHKPWLMDDDETIDIKDRIETILTFEQYAKHIGCSKKTIYNRYKKNQLDKNNIIYINNQPHIKITTYEQHEH